MQNSRITPEHWSASPRYATMKKIINNDNNLRLFLWLIVSTIYFAVCGGLFYEIIFAVFTTNDNAPRKYETLFAKTQYALTSTISLISSAFYVWNFNAVRCTLLKLKNVDYLSAETIDAIEKSQRKTENSSWRRRRWRRRRKLLKMFAYVSSMCAYFYAGYIRSEYFNANEITFVFSLKNSLTRTFFSIINAFVMGSFIEYVQKGRRRFQILRQYIGYITVDTDTYERTIRARDIDDINEIYFKTVKYCHSIRKCFQVQILLTIISDTFSIICMVLTAFNEFVHGAVETPAIIFCVIDPIVRIIQIILVTSNSVSTVGQAQKIVNCLQKSIMKSKTDAKIKEKFKFFLMEMVDEKLIFVISGFLTLNYETLVTMMGTISTYLLIMMQFKSS